MRNSGVEGARRAAKALSAGAIVAAVMVMTAGAALAKPAGAVGYIYLVCTGSGTETETIGFGPPETTPYSETPGVRVGPGLFQFEIDPGEFNPNDCDDTANYTCTNDGAVFKIVRHQETEEVVAFAHTQRKEGALIEQTYIFDLKKLSFSDQFQSATKVWLPDGTIKSTPDRSSNVAGKCKKEKDPPGA